MSQKNKPEQEEQEPLDLEKALKELEIMVEKLEGGNISLDEAFKIFEEGSELSEKIGQKINSYERKLQILNDQYKLENLNEEDIIGKDK